MVPLLSLVLFAATTTGATLNASQYYDLNGVRQIFAIPNPKFAKAESLSDDSVPWESAAKPESPWHQLWLGNNRTLAEWTSHTSG